MLLLALLPAAAALTPPEQGEVQLQLTLLDAPFNLSGGYHLPSFQQSQDLTYAVNRMAMLGVREAFAAVFSESEGLEKGVGIAVSWGVGTGLMLTSAWMHEEWHRAVMTSQGISSRNGVYFPSTWEGGLISVDAVADEDLARLKAESPQETVRLMTAGLESQHDLAQRVGDELFEHGGEGEYWGPLYRTDSWMVPVIALNELNNLLYLYNCGELSDVITAQVGDAELTVEERDFTGLDCVAWVYDMTLPDEPYETRGEHVSGVGVDRYRSWSDLSDEQQSLLKLQSRLSLLNALNPHLYGFNGFKLPTPGDRWIAQVGHVLTPFGYTIDARVGLRRGGQVTRFALHNYVSQLGWSPGLEVERVDLSLGGAWALDAGVEVWLQPADLRWDADHRRPGGRVHAQLSYRAAPTWDIWLEPSAKTEGWSQGELYLDQNLSARLGLTAHL